MLAGDKRRIGRGILATVLLMAGMYVFSFALTRAVAPIDLWMGNTNPSMGGTDYTPLYHAAVMLSLALLIPWSMALQRWLYGVRGASLHSVVSGFRFDVLGRAVVFIGPVWLIVSVILTVVLPAEQAHWSAVNLIGVFAAILLLTPLQSAGEEYGLRGLVFRIAGSWNRGPRTALVVGILVSSVLFTVIHGSTDPWLNIWYFSLAVSLAVITWRTGGIEIAVVVHALNNTLSFLLATVLHTDIVTPLLDRSAGAGSAVMLVPSVTVAAIAAVVWLRTRRTGPALTPSSNAHPVHV